MGIRKFLANRKAKSNKKAFDKGHEYAASTILKNSEDHYIMLETIRDLEAESFGFGHDADPFDLGMQQAIREAYGLINAKIEK